MSKAQKKTTNPFKIAGKPAKGKARAHFIVAVFPNGAVGIARATKGNNITQLYNDARQNAEDDVYDGVIGDDSQPDSNIAFYRVDLEIAKPVVKPVKPPKVAKAKTTRMKSPEPEPDNLGTTEPVEDDEDEDADEED